MCPIRYLILRSVGASAEPTIHLTLRTAIKPEFKVISKPLSSFISCLSCRQRASTSSSGPSCCIASQHDCGIACLNRLSMCTGRADRSAAGQRLRRSCVQGALERNPCCRRALLADCPHTGSGKLLARRLRLAPMYVNMFPASRVPHMCLLAVKILDHTVNLQADISRESMLSTSVAHPLVVRFMASLLKTAWCKLAALTWLQSFVRKLPPHMFCLLKLTSSLIATRAP